ncbi:unnamed protein product [Dibothriocephalus latus]|uniref:Uncharacterized protein n=1 Tax=Dibothriocephalus latus TaxID=60516 RepID=A0A3P7LS04_DIBLA|nr:unnamed protein product [Dibothriocephalus latus]
MQEPYVRSTRSSYKPQQAIYHNGGIELKTGTHRPAAKDESVFIRLENSDKLWLRLPLASSRVVQFPIPPVSSRTDRQKLDSEQQDCLSHVLPSFGCDLKPITHSFQLAGGQGAIIDAEE